MRSIAFASHRGELRFVAAMPRSEDMFRLVADDVVSVVIRRGSQVCSAQCRSQATNRPGSMGLRM
jgi:hypothetical protein